MKFSASSLWVILAALLPAQQPDMLAIPGGKCTMAKVQGHEDAHHEEVAGFLMSRAPVSNRQYQRFVVETPHPPPQAGQSRYRLWTGAAFPEEIGDQPVVGVAWDDSVAYCEWLSKKTGRRYRLPTEEEWELAARGGLKDKPYPWGDSVDTGKAWFGAKWAGLGTLKPAGYGQANGYGLLGLVGNVWQWTADWYVPYFDCRPVVEELKLYRVIRGGSWANGADFLKVDYRNYHPPGIRDLFVGFRVAADP